MREPVQLTKGHREASRGPWCPKEETSCSAVSSGRHRAFVQYRPGNGINQRRDESPHTADCPPPLLVTRASTLKTQTGAILTSFSPILSVLHI